MVITLNALSHNTLLYYVIWTMKILVNGFRFLAFAKHFTILCHARFLDLLVMLKPKRKAKSAFRGWIFLFYWIKNVCFAAKLQVHTYTINYVVCPSVCIRKLACNRQIIGTLVFNVIHNLQLANSWNILKYLLYFNLQKPWLFVLYAYWYWC